MLRDESAVVASYNCLMPTMFRVVLVTTQRLPDLPMALATPPRKRKTCDEMPTLLLQPTSRFWHRPLRGWVRERLGRRPRRWVGRCGR